MRCLDTNLQIPRPSCRICNLAESFTILDPRERRQRQVSLIAVGRYDGIFPASAEDNNDPMAASSGLRSRRRRPRGAKIRHFRARITHFGHVETRPDDKTCKNSTNRVFDHGNYQIPSEIRRWSFHFVALALFPPNWFAVHGRREDPILVAESRRSRTFLMAALRGIFATPQLVFSPLNAMWQNISPHGKTRSNISKRLSTLQGAWFWSPK